MGPREIGEIQEIIDGLIETLENLPAGTTDLSYGMSETSVFRERLANLRIRAGTLSSGFPEAHFPIAHRAIFEFSEKVDSLVSLFPGEIQALIVAAHELKTIWHIKVNPSVYALEIALAVSPGVYLPEDPDLFMGRDRCLREITNEINVCFRSGAFNACSVLLRRLLETLIIKVHTKNGTQSLATNTNGEFYHLGKLIDDVVAGSLFALSRNAYDAMPDLKRIGDWGAHNPNILVRKTDLEPIKLKARLCFEELLSKL